MGVGGWESPLLDRQLNHTKILKSSLRNLTQRQSVDEKLHRITSLKNVTYIHETSLTKCMSASHVPKVTKIAAKNLDPKHCKH